MQVMQSATPAESPPFPPGGYPSCLLSGTEQENDKRLNNTGIRSFIKLKKKSETSDDSQLSASLGVC